MSPELKERCTRLLNFIEDHAARAGINHVPDKGRDCQCILCDFEAVTDAIEYKAEPWLVPAKVDMMFNWPSNRATRLAKSGKLPGHRLPDGSLAFKRSELEAMIRPCKDETQEAKK